MKFKHSLRLCLVPLVLLMAAPGARADEDDVRALKRELEALKQGQQSIRDQLREIQNLLKSRGPATVRVRPQAPDLKDVVLDIGDDPFKGAGNARVVMVEFSDYQCPYCARHNARVLPEIEKNYVETGKIKYVFRDFPLERIHRQAFRAAQAANCAGDEGRYWEMHDRLFANRRAIEPLSRHAEAVGLDMARFSQCLDSGKYAGEVRADMAEGQRIGVTGTPTFVLGFPDAATGRMKAVRLVRGALPYQRMKAEIDRLLARTAE